MGAGWTAYQIGPATPGEVSGTKKRDNFLEKNPVKTGENYSFHIVSIQAL